jgi:hypothetical protein
MVVAVFIGLIVDMNIGCIFASIRFEDDRTEFYADPAGAGFVNIVRIGSIIVNSRGGCVYCVDG